MEGITTLAGLVDFLANGLSALWTGGKLALGTNAISPTIHSVFADLTAPTFTGYLTKNVVWGAPVYNPASGQLEVVGTTVLDWSGPSDNTGQVILSWCFYNTSGPNTLIAAGNLSAPITLAVPTDGLVLTIRANSAGVVAVAFAS